MDKLIELSITSGPAVLLVAAGIVWGKNLIEFFFKESVEMRKVELNKNLETYKTELESQSQQYQHELDTKLKDQKGKLEVLRDEFNIQFSHLHQERSEVIKTIYQKLVELQSAMFSFTRTFQPIIKDAEKESEERTDRVNSALIDVNNFYTMNRLFIPKETCEKIGKILQEYWDKGWDYAHYQMQFKNRDISGEMYKDYINKSREISKSVENEFPALLMEIEDLFRLSLGEINRS